MSESTNKSKETIVEQLTIAGANEIVIREGKAAELFNPTPVRVTGVITNPLKWLQSRILLISQKACYILVNRESMSISLFENETDHFKNEIVGKLEYSPVFIKFNINSGVYLTPEKMAEFFKMNRSFFENQTDAMSLVNELKNFKAKVNQEIEKANDNRGNTKNSKVQAVESNVPEKFNLILPIFKGQPKETFEVEVYINPDDLTCTLISPAANDIVEQTRDTTIDSVLSEIGNVAPGLVIIEQ
jgi:hypothetical protein